MSGTAFSEDEFDPYWYLGTYADVREAGLDPWAHYKTYGHKEGRLGGPVRPLELDHLIWRGFEKEAIAELRLLLKNGTPRERAVAGWVFGRFAASKARWKTAFSASQVFLEGADLGSEIVPHRGPWLLGIKAATSCGKYSVARDILGRVRSRFKAHADFCLAELDIDLAEGWPDSSANKHLHRIFDGSGLASIELSSGSGPRFDRLCPSSKVPAQEAGPLVSVIVPAFRAEATIASCLRSLTDQSWKNLEIIVVDDASPDGTARIAREAARMDPRIRVIQQRQNRGAYVARNEGLSNARGAFFTVHDADDWSHPQKIEQQVLALLNDATLVASASHWARVGSDLSMTLWRIEEGWVYRNVSSLMMRMEMRETLGYWDRVRVNADTEYYHRLISAYGQDAIREIQPGVPLSFGRNAPQSLTMSSDTHLSTQFDGPRRTYLNAAIYWHQKCLSNAGKEASARAAALHMAQYPHQRYFPAPDALRPAENVTVDSDYATISDSSHFDAKWYLTRNRDVLTADADPVGHYLVAGGRENRDPGPLFSDSAWRRLNALMGGDNPLLHWERSTEDQQNKPFRFDGAISLRDRPVALVFAHSADRQVFGAERSLLNALDRLNAGSDGPPMVPVTVLPSAANESYLEEIRSRSAVVEILPQLWRHRFRDLETATLDAVRELIRKYRPTQVHVNTLVLDAPLIAAREEGCTTVVHVRELPEQDPNLCRILGDSAYGLRRTILSQADRFVANSSAVMEWLDTPDRVLLRLNEIDPDLFKLDHSPQASLRVALISSNIAKKGIADFVQVARMVAHEEERIRMPRNARCRFILVGPETADLEALGKLPANVTTTGYLPCPVAAMESADLVLILSKFAESFGRTALEAMAAGRPVICYNRGTPPTLTVSGKTGFTVPADDLEAVVRAVLAMSTARIALQQMSQAARNRARAFIHDHPNSCLSSTTMP